MKPLPEADETIVLRTDFSDHAAWEALKEVIIAPDWMEFQAEVEFIDDPEYDGVTIEDVLETEKAPDVDFGNEDTWDYFTYIFIVDKMTISHPEHPIICLNLLDAPYRHFRLVPSELPGVEANFSIANMDFEDFADNVDDDGIFRGF